MAITKLTSQELYRKCDVSKFEFNTTADLEERLSALGQDRAISAVELGINIKSKGYNLFCLGPEGTGKTSLVKRILEKEGKLRKTPDDWAYVYNFDEDRYVTIFTRDGMVKRTKLIDFKVGRYTKEIGMINLKDDDKVIDVDYSNNDNVFVATKNGKINKL